jgi:hypothetical protein
VADRTSSGLLRSTCLPWAVAGAGLSISVLELTLSTVSWVPHERLHLIGWAVWPLVLVAPGTVVTSWLFQRRGFDLSLFRVLPRWLLVVGVTAMIAFGLSFGAAILFKRAPVYTCQSVFLDGRYGLDCHGDFRYTTAGEFYDVRAVHLRFASGGIGYFALTSSLMFTALMHKRSGERDGR